MLQGTEALFPFHAQHVELQGQCSGQQVSQNAANCILGMGAANIPQEIDLFKNKIFHISMAEKQLWEYCLS